MTSLRKMMWLGDSMSIVIKCMFPDEMIRRPVIYELGTRFLVVTNIKQADITPYVGWVTLDVTGEKQEIEKSIEWLKQIGVEVELLEKED